MDIKASVSVADLRALSSLVEMNTANKTLVLYSGGVGDIVDDKGFRKFSTGEIAKDAVIKNPNNITIGNTQRGQFLEDVIFKTALQDAALRENVSFNEVYRGSTDDLGIHRVNSNSFWDEASHDIVTNHKGAL